MNATTQAGTTPQEVSFTGILHDDKISLTLSQGLGTYSSLSGTVSGSGPGSVLTLAFPQDDGQLADVSFGYATVDDYNTAVAGLSSTGQGQARADADASAEAAADAAAQQAQQKLDSAVTKADEAYGLYLEDVARKISDFPVYAPEFADALAEGEDALAQTRAAYAETVQEANAAQPDCVSVLTYSGDTYSASVDTESAQSDIESVGIDIGNALDYLAGEYASTQNALDALKEAVALNPSGAAPSHDGSELLSLKRTIKALSENARRALRDATAAAQGYADEATALADRADELSNSCD